MGEGERRLPNAPGLLVHPDHSRHIPWFVADSATTTTTVDAEHSDMSADGALDAALDLMRRLPPKNVSANLARLIQLRPDLTDDLLQTVDQPLKIATCASSSKQFLLCDFNRDGDSYRSPWSNQYQPAFEDGVLPSERLRALEIEANDVFAKYAQAYYQGNVVASVYCWDIETSETDTESADPDAAPFACAVLTKKNISHEKGIDAAVWDAIHVVEARAVSSREWKYKLTSSIMLSMNAFSTASAAPSLSSADPHPQIDLSGSITRQKETVAKLSVPQSPRRSHIANIGNMIQDEEMKLRTQIDNVYFGKSAEILAGMHTKVSAAERNTKRAFASNLSAALAHRAHKH